MDIISNNKLKQVLFLFVIAILAIGIILPLTPFISGVLMAITMYIMMRSTYIKLVKKYKWKRWLAATVFIIAAVILFVAPIFGMFELLSPKINKLAANPTELLNNFRSAISYVQEKAPFLKINESTLQKAVEQVVATLPKIANATANLVSNLMLAFFLLYFMLTQGNQMEAAIRSFMPLKNKNQNKVWVETHKMVVSNAVGIPLLAVGQAITAFIGYYIFGVKDALLWAVVTGVFSVVPIVGTGIIWVPVCIYLFSTGHTGAAIGLLLYSIVVITNMDNVLRFTLLKKIGDVHPVITVFGILVGVPMFGFMGLIFGPLILSYLLLIVKIYKTEFVDTPSEKTISVTVSGEVL